jgi:hypothetical protein
MVTAKLPVYYTFRVMTEDPLVVECKKWEEFADLPMDTYVIHPDNHSPTGGCSCPAWKNNCKHMKCVREARQDTKINELFHWKWSEKKGWERIDDIRSIEDFEPPEIG